MKKIILLSAIILILPAISWAALPLDINLDKTRFGPGENIRFSAQFTNTSGFPIKGFLSCVVVSAEPDAFPPMPSGMDFELSAGESTEELDCSMRVGEAMPEGTYFAKAKVKNENGDTILEDKEQFSVSGTKRIIEADLKVCADSACNEPKAVFIAGEEVYIKIDSAVPDTELVATLDRQAIQFNDKIYKFKAQDEGSHIINVKISKQGYLEAELNKDFAVIDAPVQFGSKSICVDDGQCTPEEQAHECPQDCNYIKYQQNQTDSQPVAGIKTDNKGNKILILAIIILLLLLFVIILLFFHFRSLKLKKDIDIDKFDNHPRG